MNCSSQIGKMTEGLLSKQQPHPEENIQLYRRLLQHILLKISVHDFIS